jgi:3-phosphoshikimate 1-carboxyvinyltransferase
MAYPVDPDHVTRVINPLMGEDCLSTLSCVKQLGTMEGSPTPGQLVVDAAPWSSPKGPLDCGNSGTTMRLLAGILAGMPGIEATLVGDASLSRRPMKRVAEPLRLMGAFLEGDTPPLRVQGGRLLGIDYRTPVASAQVKSAILLAGLQAKGITRVTEPSLSRDHTERMLSALGVGVQREDETTVSLRGGQWWHGFTFRVPGDISSAAFWLAAAAGTPGSEVLLKGVGVNPTRTGVLDVLAQMGVSVELENVREELGEPLADIRVVGPERLSPFVIEGPLVPRLIDEIPVLAALATRAHGKSVIRDAKELRVKESDRIAVVADALVRMGASVESFDDGMTIEGPSDLTGVSVDASGDHRIAMSFAIAAGWARGETLIAGAESIATSYPHFLEHLNALS